MYRPSMWQEADQSHDPESGLLLVRTMQGHRKQIKGGEACKKVSMGGRRGGGGGGGRKGVTLPTSESP